MLPIACHLMCYRQVLGREQLIQKLDTVLGQVAAAGFPAVRHFIDCLTTEDLIDNYVELLDKYKLRPAGVFTGGVLYDADKADQFERTLLAVVSAIQPSLNLQTITIGPDPLPRKGAKSDRQLEIQAQTLINISEKLSDQQIRLIYRFAGPEMADDAREFKRMMRLVTSQYIGVCYDPDWVARSGQYPIDLLDQFAPRVEELQLRSSRDGVWDEVLGDGDVDLKEVIELLADYDYRGWYLVALAREAKTPKNIPLPEALKKSYDYAQTLLKTASRLQGLY
ncbi:MAG: sugar phosphate isomerase/epimerase [Planctomycetota bacterium]|nr:MAG: sugar phosphate isomerase/epimerase [Planctomycetota bacterium]